ncbi:MAG: hypothetical protein IPN71_10235 [Fibrobacteres bacterium]|nr:hypothetical protein [Fibrobacterota bacterium]
MTFDGLHFQKWLLLVLTGLSSGVSAQVNLDRYTPSDVLMPYSLYATDSIYLPPGTSGLSDSGWTGTGGNAFFEPGAKLRSPYLGVKGNLTVGDNSGTIRKLNVGGTLKLGNSITLADTLSVRTPFSNSSMDLTINGPAYFSANAAFTGARNRINGVVRAGGTVTGATVGPTGSVLPNQTFPGGLPQGMPLGAPAVIADSLPGAVFQASVNGLVGSTDIIISGGRTRRDTAFLVGTTAPALQAVEYWHCSTSLPPAISATACKGDTLQPGDYKFLNFVGNQWAVLLTEGFYTFDSIFLGSQDGIIVAQPKGGRTVIHTRKGIGSAGGNSFVGPIKALQANGFGKDSAQFLGGTLMLVSGGDLQTSSDQRVWATLSAPFGDLRFASQIMLFGQAFGRRSLGTGTNNVDFGKGAYIPFRGTPPALLAYPFQVWETANPACVDPLGKKCRDTVITVRLSAATAYDVEASWRVAEVQPASAIGDDDFKVAAGKIFIPKNTLAATISIRVFDDSAYEGPQTFRIVFDSIKSAACPGLDGKADTTIKSCEIVGTILDDDKAPILQIRSDSSVLEGNAGQKASTFKVSLLNPYHIADTLTLRDAPQLPVAFRWAASDLSATVADKDYLAQAATWDTIPALKVAKSISVQVLGDLRYEHDDAFWAIISQSTNATIPGGSVRDSGVIRNDDAMPTLLVSSPVVQEPSVYGDTAWAMFTLAMSAPSGVVTPLRWTTRDSTALGTSNFATALGDYLIGSTNLSIPADTAQVVVRIPVFGDTLYERSEYFSLKIDSILDALLADSLGTATVLDGDSAPKLTVVDTLFKEPLTGQLAAAVRLHLSRPSGLPATFDWLAADGSARSGLDYTATPGKFVFRAGLRDTTISLTVLSDSLAGEGRETFQIELSNVVDASAGKFQGTVSIDDAQDRIRVWVESIDTVGEADSSIGFRLRTDWIPAHPLAIGWQTQDGTAKAGWRFADTSASPTLSAGSRLLTLPVRLTKDTLWEPPEYFTAHLDSVVAPFGTVEVDSNARAWIREPNDLVIQFATPDSTVREDSAGTIQIKISFSQPASVPITIRFPLQTGSTATEGVDFTANTGSFTVPAGNRTWNWPVAVVPDTMVEKDETASFGLVPQVWGVAGARNTWKLTILDDDSIPVVKILTPPPGLHTKDSTHTILWTINGVGQPKKDTTFTRDGWHCVERFVVDRFNRVFGDTSCIWVDLTPPSIQVFKITGKNPHDRKVDTTWWGDLAKTRYGKDTIWYWTRDSILNSDGKAWQVVVDTQFALTDFRTEGLHPTQVSFCDSVGHCVADTGWIDLILRLPKPIRGVYYDRDGDGRIETLVVQLSDAWNSDIVPRFDFGLPPEERRDQRPDSTKPFPEVQNVWDETRFVINIKEPFRYGATGFANLNGILWEDWKDTLYADSFPIVDSVAPVILSAVIHRTESYNHSDTLFFTPSEPIRLLPGGEWLQVLSCPQGELRCKESSRVWKRVPATLLTRLEDGRYMLLVPPGTNGSIRPEDPLRFLAGVTDTLANQVAPSEVVWKTIVEGGPRPPFVTVKPPGIIPLIDAAERDRPGPGGILFKATRGGGDSLKYWDPQRGYLSNDDPDVRSVCREDRFCNGPTININRPVRMIIYLYDNGGTYVLSRTVDITQADLDALSGDKLDRLKISLQWNHRTTDGKVVGTGVYIWRIVSYVKLPDKAQPAIENSLYKVGVRVQGHDGIF